MVITGNSDSESYAIKSKKVYTQSENVYTGYGRFIRARANEIESARAWDAGLHYERDLSTDFGIFLGQKAESDAFAGFTQRDSTNLGGRYAILKIEDFNWITELGYRYSTTNPSAGDKVSASFGRLYTELNKSFTKTTEIKYWAEYLPNFTDSNAYLANTELSLSVILSEVFSLKMGYLLQYQNSPALTKRTNTTYTTSLVAKF